MSDQTANADGARREWALTLPQTVAWEDYERELAAVRDRTAVLNYRVRYAPKGMRAGDRCYLVWRGRVRGWMEVTDVVYHEVGFTCLTTGAQWPPGYYIQRSGPFHHVEGPEMTGFRGVRGYQHTP